MVTIKHKNGTTRISITDEVGIEYQLIPLLGIKCCYNGKIIGLPEDKPKSIKLKLNYRDKFFYPNKIKHLSGTKTFHTRRILDIWNVDPGPYL